MLEARRNALLNTVGWILAAVAFAALAALWLWDRSHRWETPRWEPARFAAMSDAPATTARERWVFAVNPICAHCRRRLAEVADSLASQPNVPALAALLVDVPARPDTVRLAAALPAAVYWDSARVWRERWGHRVYGEILIFDGSGRLLRTIAPGTVLVSRVAR